MPAYDRASRIGFVGEDFDPDDGSRLTGKFSAHWESADGPEHGDGPQGVSAEEAIEWARSMATRVSVLLYDDSSLYSAGEDPYPDMPEWPAEGMVLRPRPIGAPRDGSVQEIPWRASSEIEGARSFDRDALIAAIGADPHADRIELRMVRHRLIHRRLIVELDYTARSEKDACIAAHELVEAALREHVPGAMLHSTAIVGGD